MAKILVIDDDPMMLRLVGRMLEKGGHTPILEIDPHRGLQRVKDDNPDLLLLDLMMPAMSGHEVTERIRATQGMAQLPILILTARAQAVDREAALASGADGHLSKPVDQRKLIEHIDGLLAQRKEQETSKRGTVISLFSMRGGVGCTTLATNLACTLRQLTQKRTCLVDLSPSGGQVCVQLHLRPDITWADIPSVVRLDWPTLAGFMISHPSDLRLLASPLKPQSPFLPTGESVSEILGCLEQHFSYTVVDQPKALSPATLAALECSDIVLHVTTPEIVAVQMARSSKRELSELGIAPEWRAFVLNHVRPGPGLDSSSVEKGLHAGVAFQVEFDPAQERALTQGVPLSFQSTSSPLATASRHLAKEILRRQSPVQLQAEPSDRILVW